MEGHFESHPDGAPLFLFGWPDMTGRSKLDYAVAIPKLGILILKHDLDAPLAGPRHRARAANGRRWRSCSGRSASWSGSAC